MSARSCRLVVLAETALAAVLGFVTLGNRSFWLDESMSVTLAKIDWGAFVHELRVREANMSLYYLLLRGWSVLGDSEVAFRSLSVLAFAATVPVAYLTVRRLDAAVPALLAGLFVAVNPVLVRYGQEARSYALAVLLVTAAAYLFVRAVQEPSWVVWIAYAVVAALAVYVHLFAIFVPPAQALSLLFVRRGDVPWRKVGGAWVLLVALLGPFAFLVSGVDKAHGEWTTMNGPGRILDRVHDNRPLAVATLALAATTVLAVWVLARRRFGPRLEGPDIWRWAFLGLWVLVPVALVGVLGVLVRPLVVVRYFTIVVPAVLLIAAMLVVRIRRPTLAALAAAAIVMVSLVGVARWYATGQGEDWRHATRFVLDSTQEGDGVLLYAPYTRIPFALYLEREGSDRLRPNPVYPADGWETPSIEFNRGIPIAAGEIEQRARRFRRIHLVLSHVALFGTADSRYEAILRGLAAAGFEQAERTAFDGIEVARYDRR